MLTDKIYECQCYECGHVQTRHPNDDCEVCGKGPLRCIGRYGKCCGKHMSFSNFTNTYDCCGSDYNASGERLAPREQWGEDTGESLADIMMIR